jgi:hypothetical protein
VSDAPIVQVSEAGIYYRASALGGCARALLLARRGYEAKPPPQSFSNAEGTGIFDLGRNAEDFICDELSKRGFAIHHRQAECDLTISSDPLIVVRGHIDGLCEPGPQVMSPAADFTHLLELKSFGPDYWQRWKSGGFDNFPQYAVQVSCYMHAFNLRDLCMVIHNHETGEFDISFYEAPPRDLWQIELLVTRTEQLAKLTTPVHEVECTNNYPCPYYYMHDAATQLPPEAAMFAKAMDLFEQKIKSLQIQRDVFKEKLRELGVGSYERISPTETIKVTISESEQTRLKTAAVRELLTRANVLETYQETVSSKPRVTVTIHRRKPDATT